MGILLPKEDQIDYIGHDRDYSTTYDIDGLLKAQALKVLDDIEKPCTCPRDKFSPAKSKRECSFCMAEIRKELEGK